MFRWSLALGALFLGGCAQFHIPLAAENRARIAEVDVKVVVAQESFMFSAQAPGVSAAMGGGLIPALIDASVQESRQKAMASEVQAVVGPLLDFDFRAEARQAVAQLNADSTFPFKIRSTEILAGMPLPKDMTAMASATKNGPASMILLLQYALEPGLSAFTTRTTVFLWQDGKADAASFRVASIFQTPLPSGTRQEIMKKLTADDGALLRSTMQASMSETFRMIALDFATASTPSKDAT